MPETPDIDAALLEALLDAAADGIIVADSDGVIRRANPAVAAMFGYPARDLVGQSINLLMPPAMAAAHDGFIGTHLRTGQHNIIGIGRELVGQHRDGTTFSFHISVGRAELRGEVFFVSVLHDLSRRKRIEAALQQAQRMQALGQMTGSIAHDFNNILGVVTGCLELLQMRVPEPGLQPLIRDALGSADLGAQLVTQLLAFARMPKAQTGAVAVNDVVEGMVDILRRVAGDAVELDVSLAQSLPAATADPTGLQSAILNLVTNAAAAMPQGGSIRIETGTTDLANPYRAAEVGVAPGCYVWLRVTDTGAGMSADVAQSAFDPFFTTKPPGGGTGLGLSMVYSFARQSGGIAALQSRPGQGTGVTLFMAAAST
jgi:PAS domain S-box-containing protein